MPMVTAFLKQNVIWILTLVCTAAVTYYKVHQQEQEIIKVEERLTKKIKIIKDHSDAIHKIDIRVTVLETTECK